MTKQEAINLANSYARNINLHWFVCRWNDGYIIHSSNYMRRHPDTKYVYSTGSFKQVWKVHYDEKEKKFKHIVKKVYRRKK